MKVLIAFLGLENSNIDCPRRFSYEVISDNMDIDPNYLYAPKRARESSKDFKLLAEYAVHCIPPFALFSAGKLTKASALILNYIIKIQANVLGLKLVCIGALKLK